jgi:hypothetical protein
MSVEGSGQAAQSVASRIVDASIDGTLPLPEYAGLDGGLCTYALVPGLLVNSGVFALQVARAGYVTADVSNVYDAEPPCTSVAEQVVIALQPS